MDWRKNPISPLTVARAKHMHREPTYPEYRLWMKLRAGQIGGLHFRRQHPIGPYIVDFYCGKAKLAIELDGVSHDDRQAYDDQRTEFLRTNGVRVIRFTDDEVLTNLGNALHVIACECGLKT
jgi:very-short-patch-repair endonuclease